MLNDPTVLEASRVLAAKLLSEPSDTKDKIIKAFRSIVCRKPLEKEVSILIGYFNDQMKSIDPATAHKILSVGEYPIPKGMDESQLAAMMRVVTTIYNMEESITKS